MKFKVIPIFLFGIGGYITRKLYLDFLHTSCCRLLSCWMFCVMLLLVVFWDCFVTISNCLLLLLSFLENYGTNRTKKRNESTHDLVWFIASIAFDQSAVWSIPSKIQYLCLVLWGSKSWFPPKRLGWRPVHMIFFWMMESFSILGIFIIMLVFVYFNGHLLSLLACSAVHIALEASNETAKQPTQQHWHRWWWVSRCPACHGHTPPAH